MDRILFGDNQFFGVNHVSDEKSRQMSIKYRYDEAILNTLKIANTSGIDTFMCTTHDRMISIVNHMANDERLQHMDIYPCLPYAHKYANAVTELGVLGTVKQYLPGNYISSLFNGTQIYGTTIVYNISTDEYVESIPTYSNLISSNNSFSAICTYFSENKVIVNFRHFSLDNK